MECKSEAKSSAGWGLLLPYLKVLILPQEIMAFSLFTYLSYTTYIYGTYTTDNTIQRLVKILYLHLRYQRYLHYDTYTYDTDATYNTNATYNTILTLTILTLYTIQFN